MQSRHLAGITLGLFVAVSVQAADASLIDDFDQPLYQWRVSKLAEVSRLGVLPTDPLARPGQTTAENVLKVSGPKHIDVRWPTGRFCHNGRQLVKAREFQVDVLTTPAFDARSIDFTTLWVHGAAELHAAKKGKPPAHYVDVDGDGDLDLAAHFRCGDFYELDYAQLPAFDAHTTEGAFLTTGDATATIFRAIQGSQDWSVGEGIRFWFNGNGNGDAIRFQLHDNRAPDAGPGSWKLVWSDEFNGAAGRAAQCAQLDA